MLKGNSGWYASEETSKEARKKVRRDHRGDGGTLLQIDGGKKMKVLASNTEQRHRRRSHREGKECYGTRNGKTTARCQEE